MRVASRPHLRLLYSSEAFVKTEETGASLREMTAAPAITGRGLEIAVFFMLRFC